MASNGSHRHHRPQAAHHLSAHGHSDNTGWVEGIASLTDKHAATELVASDGPPPPPPPSDPGGAPEGGVEAELSPEEERAARLEHALAALALECSQAGEVLAELGTPDGYGPQGMSEAQLDAVLAALRAHVAGAAEVTVVRRRRVPSPRAGQPDSAAADVCVRRRAGGEPVEVRVAIIGNVDSGKSTMVGVLTRSILDDGRGLARSKVFKHGHEEATGRTSSIGQHNLCLDAAGAVLNDAAFRTTTIADYVARAAKVVTLVDLAGHEKYFKTTAYGLTGHLPDYACLIVGANAGVVGMCKEHLGVALALRVPVFFVVTKVDLAPAHVLAHTLATLQSILKKPGVRKKPFLVRTPDDVLTCARHMHAASLAPIFQTSAVTGEGMDLVRLFYALLPQRHNWHERAAGHAVFLVDEAFGVPGVGTVVAGTVKHGIITASTPLLLGPDIGDGSFKACAIKSIHYKRLPVGRVVAGQTAALALKRVKRAGVRKGMALVAAELHPRACWEFDADIAVLTHSTTIQPRYQAVIHCEIVRQSARVVAMDRERLRSGDRACVRFRFMQHPEYLTVGSRFVFREGRTKGIGVIVGTEAQPAPAAAAAGAAPAEEEGK